MLAFRRFRVGKPRRPTAYQHPDSAGPRSVETDSRYLAVLQWLQQRAWHKAVPMLRLLAAEYPQAEEVTRLLEEATLRMGVESTWQDKVQARSRRLTLRRLFAFAAGLGILLVVLLSALRYVQTIASLNAVVQANQTLFERAQTALHTNQPQDAVLLFQQVLAAEPDNQLAEQGYQNALRQLELANRYASGVNALAAQDYRQALELLMGVQSAAPNYRDVDRLLAQVQRALEREELFTVGDTAYRTQQWSTAIQAYEALRRLDSSYGSTAVAAQLAAAYLQRAQQLVARAPEQANDLALAQSHLQKALALNSLDAAAQAEVALLSAYLDGEQARQANRLEQAVAQFAPLYEKRPDYLAGALAQQLYQTYVALGEKAAQQPDLAAAAAWYEKAAALPVADKNEAISQIETLTAAPTATPAPVVQPPVVLAPAPPPPTATPLPTPAGLAAFQGWIAFRSNREGETAIFLMQADGSQQQRAPNDAADKLDRLYARQQSSADGVAQAYVANGPDGADANLFVAYTVPGAAVTQHMITDWSGMEYDPVWSPGGDRIAFVSNRTGNDEVWAISAGGGDAVQLTNNQWEWDKHPTWSPDGTQIAFFSNRSGTRQIWVMGADGANQRNLSNNGFEDWDPVWVR